METTREEVIELYYKTLALLRKAQCRQVNCEILDRLDFIAEIFEKIDERMTEIIGD